MKLTLKKLTITPLSNTESIKGGDTMLTQCQGCQYSARCDTKYMCASMWCNPKPSQIMVCVPPVNTDDRDWD